MVKSNYSAKPNGSIEPSSNTCQFDLAVAGDWWGREVMRANNRLGLGRPDADADWFVALNPLNDEHPAEGRWSDWVALSKAILARDAELKAKKIEP